MSIQAQINSLLGNVGSLIVGAAQRKERAEAAAQKEAEKAAKAAEKEAKAKAKPTTAAQLKEAQGAVASLTEQIENERNLTAELNKRIEYLQSAQGAAQTLGESGAISNRRRKQIIHAIEKKEASK